MRFFLGTDMPGWLHKVPVPLFVSRNRLGPYKTLPKAAVPWALDSGGFTEISNHGRWRIGAQEYAEQVRRFRDGVGMLEWAAPQDWMCEPWITQKTGLTVSEHQDRTVANFIELRTIAPDLPIIPVLQGWTLRDYIRCVMKYRVSGVDLAAEPLVGLGSVCRRQHTSEIEAIVRTLALGYGLRLHGFGVKTTGVRHYAPYLVSADSMAWSFAARMAARNKPQRPGDPPLRELGCTHANCSHCPVWALEWRRRVLVKAAGTVVDLAA